MRIHGKEHRRQNPKLSPKNVAGTGAHKARSYLALVGARLVCARFDDAFWTSFKHPAHASAVILGTKNF